MADTDSYIKQHQSVKEHNQVNPSKYYTNFLYKVVVVIIFLVIVPVFPSQAPEFINQTLLNGSWELLHLLFVGIAVSYGLFSRRNDETEKENNNNNNNNNNQSKFDNVQSFVSRVLQVSSVFDDEAENLSGSDDHQSRVVQTWSSQYHRNEPPVVVAKEHGSCSSRIAEKPLLLPVRSLKSRVFEANNLENTRENSANSRSLTRSNSSLSSKRFSNRVINGEIMGRLDDQETLVEKLNENNNVVLPSPIPWRSRSGRMEVKEDIESEFNNRLESRSFRSPSTRLSRSPPVSLSTEAQAKTTEDLVRRKSIYKSPPPPPPPPPPLSMMRPGDSLSGTRKDNETGNGIKGNRVRYDQTPFTTEKLNRESVSFMPKPTFMEFPHGEKQELVEKLVVETTDDDDDDSESEDEEVGESSLVSSIERGSNNEAAAASPSSGIDGGSDVDKKADEFIAKVREQIRVQRIDSIKRSSCLMNRNNTR